MGQWEALALGAGQEKERRQNISSPLSAFEWFLRQRLHLFLDYSSCLLDFPSRIQVPISNPEHLPLCSAALEVVVASCSFHLWIALPFLIFSSPDTSLVQFLY